MGEIETTKGTKIRKGTPSRGMNTVSSSSSCDRQDGNSAHLRSVAPSPRRQHETRPTRQRTFETFVIFVVSSPADDESHT